MALFKIQAQNIANGSISTEKVDSEFTATYATYSAVAANLTPRIASVNVANSTWHVLDDTAVNTAGGYLVITGANFQSGAIVTIGDTLATSTSYVDETTLRVQVPAKTAGSYSVYVQNPDGGTGIRVLGASFSNTPVWGTSSTLTSQTVDVSFSVNLSANSDSNVTYSNTTTLPAGTDLLSNGYFYGTVTGITEETTYTFTVEAIDAENQENSREFSVTVSVLVEDPYWSNTSLLFNANEVGQQKPVDITGNFDQFAVNPNPAGYGFISSAEKKYGAGSIGVNGVDMYLTVTHNSILDLGSGDFTVEFWLYPTTWASAGGGVVGKKTNDSSQGWQIYRNSTQISKMAARLTGTNDFFTSSDIATGEWHHWALVRYNSNIYWFKDGVLDNSGINSSNIYDTGANLWIGRAQTWGDYYNGYLDDLRITKGVARYTSNFTPPGELAQFMPPA